MRLSRLQLVTAIAGTALLALAAILWATVDRVGLERLATIRLPGRGLNVALSTRAGKLGALNWNDAWICDSATGTPIASLNNPFGHTLGIIALSPSAEK